MSSALALSAALLLSLMLCIAETISSSAFLIKSTELSIQANTTDSVKKTTVTASSVKSMNQTTTSGKPSILPSHAAGTGTVTTTQQSTTRTSNKIESAFSQLTPIHSSEGVNSSSKATPTPSTTQLNPGTTTTQDGAKAGSGSGAQSSQSAIMNTMVTNKATQLSALLDTTHSTLSVSSLLTPTNTHTLIASPVTLKPEEEPPKLPDGVTAVSSSSGMSVGSTSTSQKIPTTQRPLVNSPGKEQTFSKMTAISGTSSSITGNPSSVTWTASSVTGTASSVTGNAPSVTRNAPSLTGTASSVTGDSLSKAAQPTGLSSGSVTTPAVGEPTSTSSHWASTAPQGSNDSSPTSALGDDRVKCGPSETPNGKMLILNLTKTSLCAGSPPDDRLVILLCRAAKATFDPAHDKCHIQLARISETQAVAIKEITIKTVLPPKSMYELLKDKWDDLKEVGVSSMKFGAQEPPEETEDRFSMPLIITIVCMASFLLLVAALYGCCHQRLSQRKDQQRLTEELQTVENGYHDNPTLEVMETSSEMQEKKAVNLNGELGDSWIVPLDNLAKDDLDEEEDTHL